MKNIEYEITDENKLIITIDLNQTFGLSKSGKSEIIATTSGNTRLSTEEFDFSLGINCYKKAE